MENNLSNQDYTEHQNGTQPIGTEPSESSSTSAEEVLEYPQEIIDRKDISALQKSLDKLETELATANEKCLRIHAEFDNFRKRTSQERIALIETAGEKLLEQFLPLLDDFERALIAVNEENASLESVTKGIKLIYDKMNHFLVQANVKPMPIAEGTVFNPELQEAISKTLVSDKTLKNKIIHVVEKGYMLRDKVLRYAKVIIGE